MAKFRCAKCKRSFTMAAHLGRHMNTIHKRGGKKKTAKGAKAGKRRGPGRPPGRSSAARASAPGADRVIGEMRAFRGALIAERNSLDTQIASIERALGVMGGGAPAARRGRPPGRRPGRPRKSGAGRPGRPRKKAAKRLGRPPGSGVRAGSLKDSIVKVLRQSSQAMAPKEIAKAVKASGYKTKAKDLTKAVSNALPGLKIISKAGRGLYKV